MQLSRVHAEGIATYLSGDCDADRAAEEVRKAREGRGVPGARQECELQQTKFGGQIVGRGHSQYSKGRVLASAGPNEGGCIASGGGGKAAREAVGFGKPSL